MATVLLSLGSNIAPQRHLDAAVAALRAQFGAVRVSRYWSTAAVGFAGDDFLNAGALLQTDLTPEALDAWLHALEEAHGRRRDVPRFSSRTLDIDLVFYDDCVLRGPGSLQLPRPDVRHAFVLGPLAEIAADFIDPISGRRLGDLWREHPDYVADGAA